MKPHISEWAQMIEDCEQRDSQLSDWERSFVASLGERIVERGMGLTTLQNEKLTQIWDRVTSRRP